MRGWRFGDEVEEAVGRTRPEVFAWLTGRGLVDRTDVREEGRERPLWMYRIAAAGERVLARAGGSAWGAEPLLEPVDPDEDPEAGTLFMPTNAWVALRFLRQRSRGGEDAAGWTTGLEVARAADRSLGEDLLWLASRGLVERREGEATARRRRPLWLYRATEEGERTVLLDAASVYDERPRRVQVRVQYPDAQPCCVRSAATAASSSSSRT